MNDASGPDGETDMSGTCTHIKGLGYFLYDTKHKSPQIDIKLTPVEDNDSRKRPLNITCWGAVVCEEWLKQFPEIYVEHDTMDLRDSPENTFFSLKTWRLMKLRLLQVNYITYIFIHSE